jgi:16S rRNA (guanine966-N2)-methyltransferase
LPLEKESMRVIAGKYKGRRLFCPRGSAVRPTGDPVRETLFNVLGGKVEGARALDLFAGVGTLGIEALSRGARSAIFLEMEKVALSYLERNLAAVGAGREARIIRGDVFGRAGGLAADRGPFELVFADPPYGVGCVPRLFEALGERPLVTAGGILVVQHHAKEPADAGSGLELFTRRVFGDTMVSCFSAR